MSDLWTWAGPYLAAPQTWIAALFGSLIGSFLNVCIWRIPEGTFFKHARSVCRHCGAPIPAWLNIPVLGYLLLRGRTACCKSRLSIQYPLVEALTALLFVAVYWRYPFVSVAGGVLGWDLPGMVRCLHALTFVALLIVCSGIDFRHMIIPDVISLPMIAATPLIILVHPDLTWQSGLLGVLAGAGILYGIAWAYWIARREVGMGMGDVKLLAAIGGWLGYQAIVPTILFGSTLGAVIGLAVMAVSRRLSLKSAIPFGPFLAIGAIIHLLMGQSIQEFLIRP